MALQATGQGSRPPVTAADPDPAQRPLALGGTGCPKSAAAGFPDDAVVEILSHLPAKPLFRLKCVSKDWCELISDRLRCRKLPQTLEGFFYGCVDDFTIISSEDCCDKSGSDDSDEGCSDEANDGGSDGGDRGRCEDGGECGSKDEKLPQHILGHFINLSGKPVPLVDPLFSSLRKQPGIRSLTPLRFLQWSYPLWAHPGSGL